MQPESISHGAVKTEAEHRRDICAVGRWIHDRGYVASTDGNISVRLGPDRILITPTAISKAMMNPEDLVIIDLDGQQSKRLAKALLRTGHASADLPAPARHQRRVPRASAHRDGLRRRWHPARQTHSVRACDRIGMHSGGALRHAGHVRIGRMQSSPTSRDTTRS